jgi:hypothetical protein
VSRKDAKYRGIKCLNCETSLDISEKYCHHCGQLNSTKKLTVKDFIEEFFANFYAYDSRLRNSLVSLFTKPGILAREFNSGKRHTYANPFRLFLSVSIILFLTFNLNEDENGKSNSQITQKEQQLSKSDSIKLEKLNINVANLNPKKEQKVYSRDSIYTKKEIDSFLNKNADPFVFSILSFRNFNRKYPNKTDEEALISLGHNPNFFNKAAFNKSKTFKSNEIEREVIEYFYSKLPFFIFLSLPILTLIFWLVFYSKNINYTEHLVFAYSFFTFMFICMILFNLIELISSGLANFIVIFSFAILFPIYFYKSLRNFYQQSRWITVLKFILLNPLFGLFLGICILFMLFLGILLM